MFICLIMLHNTGVADGDIVAQRPTKMGSYIVLYANITSMAVQENSSAVQHGTIMHAAVELESKPSNLPPSS